MDNTQQINKVKDKNKIVNIKRILPLIGLSLLTLFNSSDNNEQKKPEKNTIVQNELVEKNIETLKTKAEDNFSNNNLSEALNDFFQLLKKQETINDIEGTRRTKRRIGMIFFRQKKMEEALDYFTQCLPLARQAKYNAGIIVTQAHIGEVYEELGNNSLQIKTFMEGRKFAKNIENSDTNTIRATVMIGTDIARRYLEKENNPELAKQYRKECIKLNQKINDINITIILKYDIGDYNLHTKKKQEALKYYLEGVELSQQKKSYRLEETGYHKLYNLYKINNNREEALKYKELEDSLEDERINTESTQQVNELNAKYEVDKKETELLVKDATIQKQGEQKKKMIRGIISAIIATLGTGGFALSKIKHNKSINRKNQELTKQKAIIEKTNQDNKESMEAGKQVQEKIVLSKPEYIKKLFPESFVLFKPQNGIISGDFYRFKETKSGKKLFAAVDCTGHGIPGAFMSFIGSKILNEAVEYGLEQPSDILSFLDKKIIDIQSEQRDEDTFAKYGMDIALCSRDEQTKTLEYSGAVNPIYIINSTPQETKTIEISPNKSKIGYRLQGKENEYKKDSIVITDPNTIIYLTSDGYQDQFGGKDGKKLKRSEFKKYLESITKEYFAGKHSDMTKIQKSLEEKFKKRKGNEEQIDDVMVIGIKV